MATSLRDGTMVLRFSHPLRGGSYRPWSAARGNPLRGGSRKSRFRTEMARPGWTTPPRLATALRRTSAPPPQSSYRVRGLGQGRGEVRRFKASCRRRCRLHSPSKSCHISRVADICFSSQNNRGLYKSSRLSANSFPSFQNCTK